MDFSEKRKEKERKRSIRQIGVRQYLENPLPFDKG